MWKKHILLAGLVLVFSAPGFTWVASEEFDITMSGRTKNGAGLTTRFRAEGTLGIDRPSGLISIDVEPSPGIRYFGDGQISIGDKLCTGIVQFQMSIGGMDPVPAGTGIIQGKFKKDGEKFIGKFTAVAPDMLDPGKMSFTSGKVKATLTP